MDYRYLAIAGSPSQLEGFCDMHRLNKGEFLDYWNTQEENNMDNNTEVRTDAIAPTNYERVSFLMKYLDHLIEANVNGINSINEIDAVREELNKELRVEVKQGKQRGTMGNAKG